MNQDSSQYYKARLRARGQITVPTKIREHLNVAAGDDLLFFVNEKGQIIVEQARTIPPDQAWFWTERWQKLEREAQDDIDAGRVHHFENVDDAIDFLHQEASELGQQDADHSS